MSDDTETSLVNGLLAGDEACFEAFFATYFPRVYRFVYSRVGGDEELARDVAQSTMMNAMRGIHTYRGQAALFTWLCQIGRNEIARVFRIQRRSVPEVVADSDGIQPILEAIEADSGDHPEARYMRAELIELVQEVLDFMPPKYGEALEMKYVEGCSVDEISETLGISLLATGRHVPACPGASPIQGWLRLLQAGQCVSGE